MRPPASTPSEAPAAAAGSSERRPHSNLLLYYLGVSALSGPFFPFVLLPLLFKYRTLRYTFDEEGVSMRWGALFRREIRLNYHRLQDIHLTSNVLERWLGLGKVQLQTASGASAAEMVIEGLQEVEAIRDLLYRKMLGADAEGEEGGVEEPPPGGTGLTEGLTAVAAELRAIRRLLEAEGEPSAPEGTER